MKASTDQIAAIRTTTDDIPAIRSATDTISALTARLDAIGKNIAGAYSETCSDWSAKGWASRDACLDDGRFHKVLVWQHSGPSNGTILEGSLADVRRFGAGAKAHIRVNDRDGIHVLEQWTATGDHRYFGARSAAMWGNMRV